MQDKPVTLLDVIETDSRKYVGVIDFITTKYVAFFDTSDLEDQDHRHLMILYKTYYSDIRFSIFIATHAAHFDFGEPILINKKLIKYHSKPLYVNRPFRSVSKVTI